MSDKKFDTIDRAAAKVLGDEIREAVEAVAARHGLEVVTKGGRFDPIAGTYKPSIELTLADTAQRDFERYAEMFGLKPEHFGRSFTSHGQSFTVIGIRPRARTRPVLARSADGKEYAFPATVSRLLDAAA